MDELRQRLAPLTDWLPGEVRDRLPVEAWWGVFVLAALIVLWVGWALLRSLFRGRPSAGPTPALEDEQREALGRYPPPTVPPGANVVTVYNLPARLRLVVVAPVGKGTVVDPSAIETLLEMVVPGLGQVARHDRPRVRIWPAQMSHHGFGATFFRAAVRPEPDGAPSHWILVAGRAQVGKHPVALGLALWTSQPNTIGRLNLEPHQWLDTLRLRPTG